jgi:hypothetical protein
VHAHAHLGAWCFDPVSGVLLYREMESAAKRASQQQELLNSRIAELDAESRKLRDQKYQLDTQVRRGVSLCC